MIYLDNAATTQIDNEVLEAMLPYLTTKYGNPGAIYSLGREALQAVDKAREQVAALINCDPEEIIFTSGGSEGNSTIVEGFLKFLYEEHKKYVLFSAGEHESLLQAFLSCQSGVIAKHLNALMNVYVIPTNNQGIVTPDVLRDMLTDYEALGGKDSCGLVSIMYMNNELGTINPVKELAEVVRSNTRGAIFHTDCVQAAGTIPIDVKDLKCDCLTLSSHKIHGPKGVGAIYVDRQYLRGVHNYFLTPIIYGSKSQENGFRGGTENVAGIVGFGKACEITKNNLHDIDIAVSTLKQVFYAALMENLTNHGLEEIVHVNGEPVLHNGKIINLRFDGVDAETLVLMLDSVGVCISAGSACHGHESEPSRVLMNIGLTEDEARNSVRISFSKHNTQEEAEEAGKLMANCVSTLYEQGK